MIGSPFRVAVALVAAVLVNMLIASAAWAQDCSGYAGTAVAQSKEYRERSCSGGLAEWWSEVPAYHANWCNSLPAGSPLPAKGTKDREAVLVECRQATPSPAGAAASAGEPGLPQILTVPGQVERCRGLTGDDRDLCMVQLVFGERNPELCAEVPESRCAAIVGATLMERCAELADEERLVCEMAVAKETQSIEACEDASERAGCVALVAAGRGNPDAIFTALEPGPDRDLAISMYAAELRDPALIDLITDNRTRDQALISIVAPIGIGAREVVPSDFCNQLRGGYEDDGGEGEETVAGHCRAAVALTNFAVTRQAAAETDAESEAVEAAVRQITEALARGELSVEELEGLVGR